MKKLFNKKGFTIVELVIVIAVIAILAAVLIPTFSNIISDAKENAAIQNARHAYVQYIQEHPNCVWRYKYNENNERIKYNGKEAEDEAIVIVKDFFTKYPNGQIHLG